MLITWSFQASAQDVRRSHLRYIPQRNEAELSAIATERASHGASTHIPSPKVPGVQIRTFIESSVIGDLHKPRSSRTMGRLFEQRSLAKDKDEDILNEIIRFSIV